MLLTDKTIIESLFKNKTVALIGPANTLIGTHQGKYIDFFDIVCRINNGYIINEDKKDDYGTRCDVMFNTCNCRKLCTLNRFRHFLNNCNCKYTINPGPSIHEKDHKLTNKSVYENYNDLNLNIPFFQVNESFSNERLDTGIHSIIYILECLEVKKLYISGFSFHGLHEQRTKQTLVSKITYLYDSDTYDTCNCPKKAPCQMRKDKKLVRVPYEKAQFKRFKDVYDKFKTKIVLDDYLQNLVNK